MSTALTSRIWNGTPIARRHDDGYVNATAMCKANRKRLNDYLRNDRTRDYIYALGADAGIPVLDIVRTRRGSNLSTRGTWVHPRLAVDLARWISPQFAVWMDGWFLALHGTTTYQEPAVDQLEGNGRIDYALTLLHEAMRAIDPTHSFKPTACKLWVERTDDSPLRPFRPLRQPALPDLSFSIVKEISTSA